MNNTRANSGTIVWPADITASNNRIVRRGFCASTAPRAVIGNDTDDATARAACFAWCSHSHKTIAAAKACGHKLWKALPS